MEERASVSKRLSLLYKTVVRMFHGEDKLSTYIAARNHELREPIAGGNVNVNVYLPSDAHEHFSLGVININVSSC